ncbi:MAG: 2-dehydropantoate 2-reductase [Nitrospirota bacterium]|nr:2-dehydropantoate 2-reductase [Nitrospirota bacterium]
MHTLIYGTGAVGGYFGGRLAQGGGKVTFLARGMQLTALSKAGLRVTSVDGDFAVKVNAVENLSEVEDPDLVLLTVKAINTRTAAQDLAANLPPGTMVMSLQNGIENVEILAEALGAERVIAATVFIGANVAAPGVVRHTAAGFIRAGRYPEGSDPRILQVIKFLADKGLNIKETNDIRSDMWKKMLWNLGFNGPSALTGGTVGDMIARPGIAWLIRWLIAEGAQVARAAGVDMPEGVEDATFAQTKGLNDFKTSMLQDVEAGRRIENDPFYGFLSREGSRHGVSTPLTTMVRDALSLRYPNRA